MLDKSCHFKARSFTSVDLFCGAGGLTEGFRKAGFTSAFAADFDEQAVQTFRYNHPDTVCLHRDVQSLSGKEIVHASGLTPGYVDVLCGGPPCQGYSLAGLRIADDPKNRLFLEFVRLTSELEPRVVLFENVEGIKSMQEGNVVRAIFREFERIGYCCEARILNAADYGVPQHRPRFILLAVPKDCNAISFPKATHGALKQQQQLQLFDETPLPHLTAWEALSDLPVIGAGEGAEELVHSGEYYNSYQRERRGDRFSGMIFNHRAVNHCERVRTRYAQIPEGGDNRLLPDELRTKKRNVWKLDRQKPSRTVTCNHRTDILHPILPRGTTVREAARLQSFDDDYRFFGNLTRKAKWVTQDDQVGNAVPPLLARDLALHIKSMLAEEAVKVQSNLMQEADTVPMEEPIMGS
jgi:DNA (cytosine-5)-methyltransferase 1